MDEISLYRAVVEESPDGIWVLDLDGRTRYANPRMAQLLGVDPARLATMTLHEALDETGRGQLTQHLAEARSGRFTETEVDVLLHRADGTSFWARVRESALHGPDGQVEALLHRVADNTEGKALVERLQHRQAELEETKRIARLGSWTWDVPGDAVVASAALCAVFDIDPATYPISFERFLSRVHPDDLERVRHSIADVTEHGQAVFHYDARLFGPGHYRWARARGVAVRDDHGRLLAVRGTLQDVTETKRAEGDLRDLVTQNTLMQAVSSAANEATSLEQVLREARHLVLLHDDWSRARGYLVVDGELEPYYVEDADASADDAEPGLAAFERMLAHQALEADGTVWDAERLTIASLVRAGDEVAAVVVIHSEPPLYRHDMIEQMVEQACTQLGRVAERERAAREIEAARDAAVQASLAKTDFLATMSHEIRTPLNGVIGLVDLLQRTDLDQHQARLAGGVAVAGRTLLSVINDTLDFSRIEAGRLELESVDFELRPIFDHLAHLFGENAAAKGVELIVSCHPDTPELVAGDPTKFSQVLANLVGNAVKFTEDGWIFVRATAEPAGAGTRLRVEVTDTGVGIDEQDQPGIFEPFSQADASTTRRFGGSGLGLAIAREIVHAMGGEIGVVSEPGRGSMFWFTVELAAPDDARARSADEAAARRLTGRRALVVDDNAHNRLIFSEQLGWWGVEADNAASATDGIAALEEARLRGEHYDVVLTDMAMPEHDGAWFTRALREHETTHGLPRSVVLLLTSMVPVDGPALEAAGVDAWAAKPLPSSDLRRMLLDHLLGRAAEVPVADEPVPATTARHRVLVVEDNQVNQMVAVGILTSLGYDAEAVDDGPTGVRRATRGDADLVLMDVRMPGMDGYSATRAIRDLERAGGLPRVPVIAMTASAIDGERDRCLEAGMDDFLTKPVDPVALTATLARWLRDTPPRAPAPAPAPVSDGVAPSTAPGDDADDVRTTALEAGGRAALADRSRLLDEDRLAVLAELEGPQGAYLTGALRNFLAGAGTAAEEVRAAHEARAFPELRAVVHRLRGSALNLGVREVAAAAGRLEQWCDAGAPDAEQGAGEPLVEALVTALVDGVEALRRYRPDLDPQVSDEG